MYNGVDVLVVEDSPTQAMLLHRILERHGYCVSWARNGREALSAIGERRPALVISDIVMPGMDGWELCQRIKADANLKDILVVLLTALSDTEDVIKALECGADSFFTKPYDESYLLSRIQHILTNHDLRSKSGKAKKDAVVLLGSKKYRIGAERQQILDLLLSIYETAVHKNIKLIKTQDELRELNGQLEAKVAERTAALTAEMAERGRAEEKQAASEHRYRRLFEASKDGIVILDADIGEVIDVNPFLVGLLGIPRERLLGKRIWDLGFLKDSVASPASFLELQRREYVLCEDMPLETADGRRIDVEFVSHVYEVDRRRVIQCNIRDIRERKRAEEALRAKDEELRAMTQQLWQASKLATMGELAASIAHELNNPLATVSLRVESLLQQTPEDDTRHRALGVIEQETERMGHLVANLLHFSRRSGQQISTLDVREEIEKTLELIHYHLRNRRIAVVREFAPDIPILLADRQQLGQLFLNLFTNASDAMPEGGELKIRVGVKECGSMGEKETPTQVFVEVSDTGTGIAPEDIPKVMEPFYTTKPEGKGTGLGLAICRRIVQEHHGTMQIESEEGRGTTVRVALSVANGQKTNI